MLNSGPVGLGNVERMVGVGGPMLWGSNRRGFAKFWLLGDRRSVMFVQSRGRTRFLRSVAFPGHCGGVRPERCWKIGRVFERSTKEVDG